MRYVIRYIRPDTLVYVREDGEVMLDLPIPPPEMLFWTETAERVEPLAVRTWTWNGAEWHPAPCAGGRSTPP